MQGVWQKTGAPNGGKQQSNFSNRSLEVHAQVGHIHVKGRVNEGLEEEVAKLVKTVPGVNKVTTDVYSVPPEAFLGP